jgi:hypothetical protein
MPPDLEPDNDASLPHISPRSAKPEQNARAASRRNPPKSGSLIAFQRKALRNGGPRNRLVDPPDLQAF